MPIVNGYCTETQVRDQFGDDGSLLDQALIERAINATSRAIDRFTGRRFWQDAAVVARSYRPRETDSVIVHDISTTTGLIVATDDAEDGTFSTTWAASDYQLDPLDADTEGSAAYAWWGISAVGTRAFPVIAGRRPTLRVTSRGGWSGLPDDVNEAAILKSSGLFKRKDAPFGIAGFGEFGPVRIGRRDHDVIELLHPFVRYLAPDI